MTKSRKIVVNTTSGQVIVTRSWNNSLSVDLRVPKVVSQGSAHTSVLK